MDNPHIFDELTNRLNKVKRPDSGIHNSGEFIGDNDAGRMDKSDEQVDSGQESDTAEQSVDRGKRGGILKNFKKMFKMKRKSKSGKISGAGDGTVLGSQFRAVSEPEMISSSKKDIPTEVDFTSDDEDRLEEKRSGSLKNAPSFIRSSLRKLKVRRSKERKPDGSGMDYSPSLSPTPGTRELTQPNSQPTSPKKSPRPSKSPKSPKKPHPLPSGHNVTRETKAAHSLDGIPLGGILKHCPERMCPPEIIKSKPVSVNAKESSNQSAQAVMASSAAKDKIRVAPRGRKKPTRNRTYTSPASPTTTRTPPRQKSGSDARDVRTTSLSKKDGKDAPLSRSLESSKMDDQFDSFITTLESVSITDTSTPRKPSSSSFVESKRKSRELGEFLSSVDKPRTVEKFQIDYVPLKDDLSAKVASGQSRDRSGSRSRDRSGSRDRSQEASRERSNSRSADRSVDASRDRSQDRSGERSRENSFNLSRGSPHNRSGDGSNNHSRDRSLDVSKDGSGDRSGERPLSISLADVIKNSAQVEPVRRSKSFKTTIDESETELLPNIIVPLKDESESSDSRRYGKFRKNHSPESVGKSVTPSKSMEDVSRLNRENLRRSGELGESGNPSRSLLASTNNSRLNDENIRKSVERLKKSSSRQSISEITGTTEEKVMPRKLKSVGKRDESKTDTGRKPRPQSVTVRCCDATDIISQMSSAKSFGDVRCPPSAKDETCRLDGVEKTKETTCGGRDGSGQLLEFRRLSLKKTGRTNELLTRDDVNDAHVKPNNVGKSQEDSSQQNDEPKNVHPEFHRISLRKVEKREDYLEKESDAHTAVNAEPRTDPELNTHQDDRQKHVTKERTFPFQSHDVKQGESTATATTTTTTTTHSAQTHLDKRRISSLSQQTNTPSYLRRSIDVQESTVSGSGGSGGGGGGTPAWIAMARDKERHREERTHDDGIGKGAGDDSQTDDDVQAESLVKPSDLKSKPTILPKPSTSPPKSFDTSLMSTSPTGKKPPPITQRPRFNSKDQCIVCSKTAYVLERIEVNKSILHKSCAKCHVCSRTLQLGGIFVNEGKVWCKTHR